MRASAATRSRKMLAQFEAWGYSNGADGKPDSPTTSSLARRRGMEHGGIRRHPQRRRHQVRRHVERGDGPLHPNIDGPNPARSGQRNNVGDVWVVAKVGDGERKPAPTLRARASS
jgi:quinohemoprotein amine dehydrogenase